MKESRAEGIRTSTPDRAKSSEGTRDSNRFPIPHRAKVEKDFGGRYAKTAADRGIDTVFYTLVDGGRLAEPLETTNSVVSDHPRVDPRIRGRRSREVRVGPCDVIVDV